MRLHHHLNHGVEAHRVDELLPSKGGISMSRTRSMSFSKPKINTSWRRTQLIDYDDPGKPPGWNPGNVTSSGVSSCIPFSLEKSMTDVSTPSFERISKRGGLVFSPMSQTETIIENVPTNVTCVWESRIATAGHTGWYQWTFKGTKPSSEYFNSVVWPTQSPSTDHAKSVAVAEAFARISATDALVWASVGEIGENIRSIRKLFKAIIRLLIRRNPIELRRFSRTLKPKDYKNIWMSLRYELRPMYYEIQGYINALKHNTSPTRQTFRGYSADVDENEFYQTKQFEGCKVKTLHKVVTRVQARAGVLTSVGCLDWPDFIGLRDIPESLWELVPLSWLIDWFINVGITIASWTPNPKFKVLGSWVTLESVIDYTVVKDSYELSPVSNVYTSGHVRACSLSCDPFYRKKVTTKSRIITPDRPLLPSIDLKLDSWPKLFDLICVLSRFT